MSEPLARRAVLGRYELGEVIGRGGAATVYRAVDRAGATHVAVKEIPVGHEMARRAGAEVRAACLLDHPGLVKLLDFGEDSHAAYLVSELVDGETLARHYRSGTLDDRRVLAAMADVFGGLAHAHSRGVTHRDIKPGNILVDGDGNAKLTDFGIARIVGDQGLTHTGGLVGTMSYMSPEHARGESTGPWSDVYSACVVLREGLTGDNPLAGDNHVETLRRAGAGVVPPLATDRPDLPRSLCDLIDAGLARDPSRRPTAAQMSAGLSRILAGGAIRAPRGRRAARTGTRRAIANGPVPAPGRAVGGAMAGVVAALAARRAGYDDPATMVAAGVGFGAAFALAPWVTTLVGWAAATWWLATIAPAAGALLGALGLIAVLPMRRRGHLLAIPIAAPLMASMGLVPVIALLAGLVPGTLRRVWVAAWAALAALTWQLLIGADPALDGSRMIGAWPDVRGQANPVGALGDVGDVAAAHLPVVVAAGVLVAGALLVPAVMRVRRGLPRTAVVVVWVGCLVVGVAVAGGSIENALGAMVPGGILVAVGVAVPWQRLRLGARPMEAVTLGATMDREPTA